MDKYEIRRLRLIELKDNFCNGKIANLAEKLGKDQSYVGRMLYPEGKAGKKRIGDDMLDVIANAFQIPKSQIDNEMIGENAVFPFSGSLKNETTIKMPDDAFKSDTHHIPSGSEIWIDENQTEIVNGRIYLVEYDGVKCCRRLFRQPENLILLSSDNPLFPNDKITADKVKIIGRVTAWKVNEQ